LVFFTLSWTLYLKWLFVCLKVCLSDEKTILFQSINISLQLIEFVIRLRETNWFLLEVLLCWVYLLLFGLLFGFDEKWLLFWNASLFICFLCK
jgi:hypothetical protein